MRTTVRVVFATLGVLASAQVASAQSLKEKLVGAYTLVEGSEVLPDGKKVVPWSHGALHLSPSGRVAFFVLAKDRPKTGSPRKPAEPMVAWYGSYTVDEAAGTYTATIEGASAPDFEGAKRVQKITFQGDTMTTTGDKVKTPEGEITPVNVWKKVQAK